MDASTTVAITPDSWVVRRQRIEARESDPDIDALITDLRHQLSVSGNSPAETPDIKPHGSVRLSHCDLESLADLIAERVYACIEKRVA